MSTITGTNGDDFLEGTASGDTIFGLDGGDTINGRGGDDSLVGGDGEDWFETSAGDDTLDPGPTAWRDRLDFRDAASAIDVDLGALFVSDDGMGGQDTLLPGNWRVIGSDFDDSIVGSTAFDSFTGELGDDTMDGVSGGAFVYYGRAPSAVFIDLGTGVVTGGEGNDLLRNIDSLGLSNYDDSVTGTDADEYFILDWETDVFSPDFEVGGADTVDGRGGFDIVDYGDAAGAVTVDLADETATDGRGNADTLINIEEVRGSAFDDDLTGDAGDNELRGNDGNDTLDGGAGNDTLEGGLGDDLYEFGARAPGQGLVIDTGGEDTLRMEDTPERDGFKFYVSGDDIVQETAQGYVTTLQGATAGPGRIEFVTWFRDGAAWEAETGRPQTSYEAELQLITDVSQATSDAVLLAGTLGDDVLALPTLGTGNARFVEVYGNDGDDQIAIQSSLYSVGYGGDGNDVITGTTNFGLLLGDAGDDSLVGLSGDEQLEGGAGNDTMSGGGGNDTLDGGDGNDVLNGGADNDTLRGGDGDDVLNPGSGSFDWLYPGAGNDTIDMRDAGAQDYAITFYNDVSAPITATFDVATGTGTVSYGAFVDTFLGLVQAANPWGFGIAGSQNDDTFNVTQIDGGFTYIQGQGGSDTYNIDLTDGGIVRIDFTFGDSGVFQGIVADMTTGVIVDAGGFTDQLNLTQGAGTFQLEASNFDDSIAGNDEDNHFRAKEGDDTLDGQGGDDSLRAGAGDDSVTGGDDDDTLDGGDGDDTLEGGTGNDTYVYDFRGADLIEDTGGTDQLDLFTRGPDGERQLKDMERDGDDLVISGLDPAAELRVAGAFASGSRLETVLYRAADGRWDAFDPAFFTVSLLGVEDAPISGNALVVGSDAGETLTAGTGGVNDLFGGGGDDTLLGGANEDWFYDGLGDDLIEGGAGDDTWVMRTGEDTFDGGDGQDRVLIDLTDRAPGLFTVETNLATGESGAVGLPNGRDVLENVENYTLIGDYDVIVTGSDADNHLQTDLGDDTLIGDRGDDTLEAGAGADTLSGGLGEDSLSGGDGDDLMRGNTGEDTLDGGAGDDQLRGQKNADLLDGGDGDDNVKGGGGNDTLFGGEGRDFLNGGTRRDLVEGGAGRDKLIGRSFDDTLIGGDGNDRLNAGGDDDRLEGGAGRDVLKGGAGADVFVFDTGFETDRVIDFDMAEDRLEVSAALAGGRDADGIAALASVTGRGVDIAFGDGDVVELRGLADATGLAGQIDIV